MGLTASEVDERISRFIARVATHVPVSEVYLFGSYARGNADDYSDIDLAVISEEFGRNRHRELTLLSRCRLPDAIEIEAIPFSAEELHTLPPGSLLREILRTGRRVHGT